MTKQEIWRSWTPLLRRSRSGRHTRFLRHTHPNSPLLALGAIRLLGWELLSLLSPSINGGYLCPPKTTRAGFVRVPSAFRRIFSQSTANHMVQLLQATTTKGSAKSLFQIRKLAAAGKTGTSEKSRDLWFYGPISADFFGLVWIGNSDETPIQTIDGIPASMLSYDS